VGNDLKIAMSLPRAVHDRSMRVTATGSVARKARRVLEERNATHVCDVEAAAGTVVMVGGGDGAAHEGG